MKAPRTRIAPNIYQYPDGRYEVLVSAAGRVAPATRFPATTPLEQIVQWIEAARKRLKQEARDLGETSHTQRGTLRSDAPDYLAQIQGRAGSASDTSHLRAWFEVVIEGVTLGDVPRSAITTGHVNKAISQWQQAPSAHAIRRVRIRGYTRHGSDIEDHERAAPATSGRIVAALTIRHRCRVLQDLYRTLDRQPDAPTPWTPVDYAKVLERLAQIDARTFGRFYVAAATGQRPCQIGLAQAADVLLVAGLESWVVRNAKGEPAHTILLNPIQVAAWQAFIAADAWGAFDTSSYGKRVHAAGWPTGVRPYTARHSLARAALNRGASLGDVQAQLGHLDPNTTRRTYAPFQIAEQRRISEQLGGGRRTRAPRLGPYLGDVLKPRLVPGAKTGAKK
jgi:integrase